LTLIKKKIGENKFNFFISQFLKILTERRHWKENFCILHPLSIMSLYLKKTSQHGENDPKEI
jgi:hypothetical protein